jgi:DNA polymerase III delta prime subunit
MDNVQQNLLSNFKRNTLSHFYIIEFNNSINIKDWFDEFFLKLYNVKNSDNNPDILTISPEDPTKDYTLSDFDSLFNFIKYGKIALEKRFIIVTAPQSISKLISNKLLKTLEEPPKDTTIIFALPAESRSFLPTIQSRAIKLKVTYVQQNIEEETVIPKSYSELAKTIKDNSKNQKKIGQLSKDLLAHCVDNPMMDHFNYWKHLQNISQWNELAQTFRNAPLQRLSSFVSLQKDRKTT